MAAPEMHLVGGVAVARATGEIPDEPTLEERVVELEEQLEGAERELRSKRAQITKLMKRAIDEADSARKSSPQREAIEALFDLWRELTGHARSKLTPQRFDECADRLAEDYSVADITMALHGLKAGAWTSPEGELKNDWKVVMRDGSRIEAYANKCPAEKRNEIRGTLFEVAR